MQLSLAFFTKDIPAYDDPKLGDRLQGIAWQEGDMPLVEWNNPRAVDRLGFYMHLSPQLLALHQPCLYLSGSGLCPLCYLPYGSKLNCVPCCEYREHFQVLASEITFLSSGVLKNDFNNVLEHLLLVGPEARNLILLETTARPLSVGGPVVMFRGHARLQPGNQPGVNAVARETPSLPRYLSFARSAATLDTDPHFGFLWHDFLRALSSDGIAWISASVVKIGGNARMRSASSLMPARSSQAGRYSRISQSPTRRERSSSFRRSVVPIMRGKYGFSFCRCSSSQLSFSERT